MRDGSTWRRCLASTQHRKCCCGVCVIWQEHELSGEQTLHLDRELWSMGRDKFGALRCGKLPESVSTVQVTRKTVCAEEKDVVKREVVTGAVLRPMLHVLAQLRHLVSIREPTAKSLWIGRHARSKRC